MRTDLSHLSHQELIAVRNFVERLPNLSKTEILSVLLFGSRARGEATPDSDIDIAVIVANNDLKQRKAIRFLAVDIGIENGLLISTSIWGEDQWNRLKEIGTGLYRNIHKDGIQILDALEKS